jgi:type IV pilus assembly protein PilA
MNSRLIALSSFLLLCGPADAAAPAPESLLTQVPSTAIVIADLRRGSLSSVHSFIDGNAAMRGELAAFLGRNVGIDLTTVESAVAWSSELVPEPTWGALLRFARSGELHGTKVGAYEGVDLIGLGSLVGASLPAGLLVGNESEVRRAISVAHKRAPALALDSPLQVAFADRSADFIAAFDPMATGNQELTAMAQQYGARRISFSFHTNQIALEVSGDAAKLQTAQALLSNLANAALAQMKLKKEQAAQGTDVGEGVTTIIGYYQAAQLWKEAAPKMVGNKLVSQYQFPDSKSWQSSAPVMGIMAAVAIPAYMKYIRRSKTVEASVNVRKLADAAAGYASTHKKARFPASTKWTPAASCCGKPGDQCAPDAHAWDAPTWKALNFSISDSHYYQYRVTTEGKGAQSRMTVEARGDLDCDGIFSDYKRTVTLDPQGNPITSKLQTDNEIE